MDLFSCLSPFVFCSFASGSSGNCYYVGKQDEGILVDVGITAQQILKSLAQNDLSMDNIKAVLITHDHIDHVKGLEVLMKNHPVPIYAHADCLQGLAEGSARYWEGEAENLHLSSFRRISESHEEIIRRLSEHPRDLMTMAGIYAEGEEKSSEDANSLQNNVFG